MKIDGQDFEPARIREPKPGVVEQYREDRHLLSRHAYELEGGELVIDHTDLVNPDKGPAHAAAHFVADHPIGRCLVALFGIVLVRKIL